MCLIFLLSERFENAPLCAEDDESDMRAAKAVHCKSYDSEKFPAGSIFYKYDFLKNSSHIFQISPAGVFENVSLIENILEILSNLIFN